MGQGQKHLRLIGVHESGEHLMLADADGGRYLVPLDDTLKAAARRDRPRMGQLQIEIDGAIRPREVQALLRTGLTPEEIADRTGWNADRIRRYEGPVLAEREYAANLAQEVWVRGGSNPLSLGTRVSRRLHNRGVDPASAQWDSVRSEEGNWTVSAIFSAGGRERTASWYFDLPGRTVVPANDEARWLSEEDVPGGPIPAPHPTQASEHSVAVFDVEADGGVSAPRREVPPPIDLMQAMRDGSGVRSRRRRRRAPSPTDIPLDDAPDALPLDQLNYDPETMGDPPGARGEHPGSDAPAASEVEPDSEGESGVDGGSDGVEVDADTDGGEVDADTPAFSDEPGLSDEHGFSDEPLPLDDEEEDGAGEEFGASEEYGDDRDVESDDDMAAGDSGHDVEEGRDDVAADFSDNSDDDPRADSGVSADQDSHDEDSVDRRSADQASSDQASSDQELDEPTEQPAEGPRAEAPKPKGKTKNKRPSVPSWDDIMFGSRSGEA